MAKANSKVSETILRVSNLLLKLMEKPLDYDEIFECFEKKVSTQVYTTEVLKKYFNTLRALGLEISKEKGKYILKNFLVQISLSKEEITAFNHMEISILKYGTNNNIIDFISFKKKLMKFLDKKSQEGINHIKVGFFNSKTGMKIKEFQQICDEGQRIKIEYKNQEMIVEPKDVSFINSKVYFECLDCVTATIKKLVLEKVKLISRQPLKNKNLNFQKSVVFELSGKLSKNYKLKEGESVLAENPNKLFVKNDNEDYEFLAQRLIRYKEFCKIIKPDEFKEYFVNYTDKILDIYKDEEL